MLHKYSIYEKKINFGPEICNKIMQISLLFIKYSFYYEKKYNYSVYRFFRAYDDAFIMRIG